MSEIAQALGQKLKAERERRGVSAQKMADDMHLDAWVIDALESGDYQRIGPSVYAKGHLKKYAGILGVSTAEPGTEPKPPPPTGGVPPMPIIRMDPPPAVSKSTLAKLGGLAALIIVAAGIIWWRPWHRAPATTAAAVPASPAAGSAPAPGPAAAAAAGPPDSMPAAEAAPDTPGVSAAAAQAGAIPVMLSKPAPASSADLTPGVGRARLRLSFSADSRVDVYDYSGRRIFTGNGRANSVKTIAGIAPFRVYLGFASGVQLQVNDRAVAIGPQFVSGDVARFEAGADGVLRRESHPPSTDGAQASAASPRG